MKDKAKTGQSEHQALLAAREQLVSQKEEIGKQQEALGIAHERLIAQIDEKEKLTADLLRANNELGFQNKENNYHELVGEIDGYAIALLDEKGIIKDWNKGAEKLTGYSEQEIIGKGIQLFYTPADRLENLPENLLSKAALAGKASNEGWRLRKNGSRFWGSVLITALHSKTNKLVGFSKITRDLTERKDLEEKQKEINERLESQVKERTLELLLQNNEKEKRAAELIHANKELAFQNDLIRKRAAELGIANVELAFQGEEKEKRATELDIANTELAYQDKEKGKRAAELNVANIELAFQDQEKAKRAEELLVANKELAFQNEEKEKRAAELSIANIELVFQNKEKEKRAAELSIANIELAFQNKEKEKRAAELSIANIELVFQNDEKEKRAAELGIANTELAFQNEEKEKRAAELGIANKELRFQNKEKEKRAAELGIANIELAFQNTEKEKRAAELSIANKELVFQNEEKEKRAAELSIANLELVFQSNEKEKRAEEREKRAAELVIANKELVYQNEEKEKRAAELILANEELVFQNAEKEKRAAELVIASRLKIDFLANMSHELRTPLNAVLGFSELMIDKKVGGLNDKQLDYLNDIHASGSHLLRLINNILDLAKIESGKTELRVETFDMSEVIEEVVNVIRPLASKKNIEITQNINPELKIVRIDKNKFRQILYNLLSNAIKFSFENSVVHLETAGHGENYFILSVKDYGIGISKENLSKLFIPFVQLDSGLGRHYEGSGLGLTITKNIASLHKGEILVESEPGKGSTFSVILPVVYKKE